MQRKAIRKVANGMQTFDAFAAAAVKRHWFHARASCHAEAIYDDKLDPNYIQHEWHVMRQTEREELGVAQMVLLEVLQTLRGVKKPETRDREVNLAEERIKSVEELGTILPELLRNMCIWRCMILFISGSVESSICCDAALA